MPELEIPSPLRSAPSPPLSSVEHLLSTYYVPATVAGPGAIAKDSLYSISHCGLELGREHVECVRNKMGAGSWEAPPGGWPYSGDLKV